MMLLFWSVGAAVASVVAAGGGGELLLLLLFCVIAVDVLAAVDWVLLLPGFILQLLLLEVTASAKKIIGLCCCHLQ